MPQQHRPLQEEDCPVSDEFVAELHRSNPDEVDRMIASVDPYVRARLALYCYRRSHLFRVGLMAASACEEHQLTHCGGRAGFALFAASRESRQQLRPIASSRLEITLARGKIRDMGPLEEE